MRILRALNVIYCQKAIRKITGTSVAFSTRVTRRAMRIITAFLRLRRSDESAKLDREISLARRNDR